MGGIPVSEMGVEDWDAMMNLNLKSAFLCCRCILPHMKERKSGKIVNVSARAGLSGVAGMSAYCVSKGGVRVLTESVAEEVKDLGLTSTRLCRVSLTPPQIVRQCRTKITRFGCPQPTLRR